MSALRVLRGARASAGLRWFPVGASAAALLLVGTAFLAQGPRDEQEAPLVIDGDLAVSDEEPEPIAEELDEPILMPLVAYELFLSRDPFEPVVEEPEPEPSEPVDTDDPNGTSPADPSDPTAPGGNGTAPPPDGSETGRCRGVQEVVCDGIVLTIEEVREIDGERVAIIVVDDVRWQVREGERFAEAFELLRIQDDGSLRLIYGDEVFTLRAGESALK